MQQVVSDLPRAAYLVSHGAEPVGTKTTSTGLLAWIFEWSEELERLSQLFFEAADDAGIIKRYMKARGKLLDEASRVKRSREAERVR